MIKGFWCPSCVCHILYMLLAKFTKTHEVILTNSYTFVHVGSAYYFEIYLGHLRHLFAVKFQQLQEIAIGNCHFPLFILISTKPIIVWRNLPKNSCRIPTKLAWWTFFFPRILVSPKIPLKFDFLSAAYQKPCVIKCRVTCTCTVN